MAQRSHNEPNNRVEGNESVRTSRREVLTGVAISGSGAFLDTKSVLSESPTTDIITVKQGDKVIERKSVPSDWWNQIEKSKQVRAQIQSAFEKRPDVVSIGLTADDSDIIAGRKAGAIIVETETGNTPEIPSHKNGVRIFETGFEPPTPSGDPCFSGTTNDSPYDRVS